MLDKWQTLRKIPGNDQEMLLVTQHRVQYACGPCGHRWYEWQETTDPDMYMRCEWCAAPMEGRKMEYNESRLRDMFKELPERYREQYIKAHKGSCGTFDGNHTTCDFIRAAFDDAAVLSKSAVHALAWLGVRLSARVARLELELHRERQSMLRMKG